MKTPYILVGSLKEAIEQLDPSSELFLDTETVKLYGKIRLVQLYQKGMEHVLMVEWPNPFELFVSLTPFKKVLHNAHYDLTTIQENSQYYQTPKNFECTFLLARLHFAEQEKFSLDDVMYYCLGFDPYERQGLNKAALQKSDWSKRVLTADQLLYAATDVYYLPQVWDQVKHKMDTISYKLDKHTLEYCLEFQWHGMPIDQARIAERIAKNSKAVAELNMPINVNSYQQVRKYLNCEASDDLALAKLELRGNEKAAAVRKTRKLLKQLSFLKKFKEAGLRIRGKFKPSARSGRLTSDDENLQQLPRALKAMFGFSPDEGRVLLYADYSQLELRTVCAITACLLMADLYRKGADLHKYTAEFLFGATDDPVKAKWNRQVAKGCNFLLLYGGGVPMFVDVLIKQMMIWLQESEASVLRVRWRKLWREVYAWQEKGITDWRKGRLGSTPLGRQYLAKMMTDQLNIENQGAGAEVAKLALHYFMRDKYSSYPKEWNVLVCDFIHDSYILEAPNDPELYKVVAKDLAECMQLAWFEMSKCFKIKDLPMPVKVAVGYNWGDIEDEDIPNLYDFSLEPMAMYGVQP